MEFNDQDVDLNNDVDTDVDTTEDTTKETEPQSKAEKTPETPAQKRARLIRQLKRVNKDLGIEEEEVAPVAQAKSQGLDKLDRAVLRVEKITATEEIELVQDWMKDTGKDVEQVLASVRFQAELSELREKRAAKEAAPQNSKRSGQSARDEVEYWLAKGPGPDGLPKDNPELARKVVAARRAKVASTNQFSDDPIQ